MDKSSLIIYDQRNRRHTTDVQLGIPYTELNKVEQVKIDPDFKPENIKYNIELLSTKGTFTGDGSAEAGDILVGRCAYVKGEKVEGTIPRNGQLIYEASREDQQIPFGYTTGGIVKAVTAAIDPDIVPEKILKDVEILGVIGSVIELHPESITIPPSTIDRVFEPQTGNGFVQVNVDKVTSDIDANIQANNIRKDVTILGVTGNIIELLPEEITIDPSTESQLIRPSSGKNGITRATVNPVTAAIDPNIVPANIKKNVTILGVQGLSSVVDTVDADAVAEDIAFDKTAYVNGSKVTGTVQIDSNPTYTSTSLGTDNAYLFFNVINSTRKIIPANAPLGVRASKDRVATAIELTAEKLLAGQTACGVTGTATSDATAIAADIKSGSTAYVNGQLVTGTAELTKNYTSIADMNADLINIAIGQIAKVTADNTTTIYVKEATGMKELVKLEDTISPQEAEQTDSLLNEILDETEEESK